MSRESEIYKATTIGSIGNLFLLLFKFTAGILGRSSAMIADAVHSLSDFVTDIIVLVFVKLSSKPSDHTHDYGHGKYETLATALVAVTLFAVGVGILWKGVQEIWRFYHGAELAAPGKIALYAALMSIVVKEVLYHYTVRVGRKVGSNVVVANAWHHRSDAFSSIGTALGIAGAIFLGAKGRVLDPIAAVIVSFFIMRSAWMLIKPAIDELLERSLPEETEAKILEAISQSPEAIDPHNLRTRRIGNYAAVDVHVRMNPNMTVVQSHAITVDIERRIKALLGDKTYVYVHVEPSK